MSRNPVTDILERGGCASAQSNGGMFQGPHDELAYAGVGTEREGAKLVRLLRARTDINREMSAALARGDVGLVDSIRDRLDRVNREITMLR